MPAARSRGTKRSTAGRPKTPRAKRPAKPSGARAGQSLSEYRRKRDFAKTAEPGPEIAPAAASGKAARAPHRPIFVIQQHHATRLHWDFRLEANGVLKSWAVTREPTRDPAVKRLAVRVEDHPLGYATFKGTIPAGQYGAGVVKIWDRGTYDNRMAAKVAPMTVTESIAAGHVEVVLAGDKLKGAFALVRMGGPSAKENWLLIKMRDEHAAAAEPAGADAPAPATGTLAATKTRKPRSKGGTAAGDRTGSPRRSRTSAAIAEPPGKPQPVAFTGEDKVLFPEAGVTKGALLRYYEAVADKLLPHLRDRPLTLERLPDGLKPDAPHFWQKNTPAHYPDWIRRVPLKNEQGKTVHYALADSPEALLYFVNQGAITLHPWFSRVVDLDHPDFVVFDLDPGDARFADVVTIAKQIRALLSAERVEPYVKTSGKSGLHVMVPWLDPGGFDEARTWAATWADRVVERLPAIATTARAKAARRGRVYVDVMQNDRGKHAVPPYVVRATPGATVSTPLDWDELTSRLDPRTFDLLTAAKRFARKADPLRVLTGQ